MNSMNRHGRIRRAAAVWLCLLALAGVTPAFAGGVPRGNGRAGGAFLADSGRHEPVLRCQKTRVRVCESVVLTWDEPGATGVDLWYTFGDGDFVLVASLGKSAGRYEFRITKPGDYSFTLGMILNGRWEQSSIVYVTAEPVPAGRADDPVLYISRVRARAGEEIGLSWNEPRASACDLWHASANGEWTHLCSVDKSAEQFKRKISGPGTHGYFLAATVNGEIRLSNTVYVEAISQSANKQREPLLNVSRTAAAVGESVVLTWNEPAATACDLWYTFGDSDFKYAASPAPGAGRYEYRLTKPGRYGFCLGMTRKGKWEQSNIVYVEAAEESRLYRPLGMNNTWNLLFMVYRRIETPGFKNSFSDAQIKAVRQIAGDMKTIMEGLSDGLMRIGSTDVIVVDDPVSTVTGPLEYGGPPTLRYGPAGDVDFSYIMDHKDVTLAVVVAPLAGMKNGYGWLGLGGTYETYRGRRLYTVIINDIDTSGDLAAFSGRRYRTNCLAFVHEILHAVETNSRDNGFSAFQQLHDGDENGYRTGTYPWYRVLMTDTLANGKNGFRRISYYVPHYAVPAGMADGYHRDNDGVTRRYVNGIPVR